MTRVTQVLNELEHPPQIGGRGSDVEVQVICDIYVENADEKKKLAFELKAPLPNSVQTKVSKEKMLKLNAMDPPLITAELLRLAI